MNSARQETTENSESLDILFTKILLLHKQIEFPWKKKYNLCSFLGKKFLITYFHISTNCSDYLATTQGFTFKKEQST